VMQQTTTGVTQARRAGFDRQRLSQLPLEPNPALVRQAQQRTKSIENRVADRITAFAGSMPFVYIHIAWFSCWIGFGFEGYPYGSRRSFSRPSCRLKGDLRRSAPWQQGTQPWQRFGIDAAHASSCN
jgi:hypothetical protein